MKRNYIFCLLVSLVFLTHAQNVNIPDPKFKSYLVSNKDINTNNDTEISVQEAETYTGMINLRGKRTIYSIAGIEFFIKLSSLNCFFTSIDHLDISKNSVLTKLNCGSTKIISLDVSKNSVLKELSCQSNKLSTLDLSKNKELTSLECSRNDLTILDLSNNPSLTHVYCGYNKLTALDVSKNAALKLLDCNGNFISSLDLLIAKELNFLNCYNNKLSSLDIRKNVGLTSLDCSLNNLSELDVKENINLVQLRCSINSIHYLDVSKAISLTRLECNYNKLTNLNVSENDLLQVIYCNDNLLSGLLDLSNCTELLWLDCKNLHLHTICVYSVERANLRYVKDDEAIWTENCTVTNINGLAKSETYLVYPNPVTSFINVISGSTSRIYNVLGQLVISSDETVIGVEHLPKGMYQLILKTPEQEIYTQKIVKE